MIPWTCPPEGDRPAALGMYTELPRRGWELGGITDHGGTVPGDPPGATCMWCGRPEIRWLHELYHPETDNTIFTGCCCAERLTEDPHTPRALEKEAKARARRRGKWCRLRWRRSERGNHFINHLGHHVVVFPAGPLWRFRLDGEPSRRRYATERDAMLAGFDAAWPMPRPSNTLTDYEMIFGR